MDLRCISSTFEVLNSFWWKILLGRNASVRSTTAETWTQIYFFRANIFIRNLPKLPEMPLKPIFVKKFKENWSACCLKQGIDILARDETFILRLIDSCFFSILLNLSNTWTVSLFSTFFFISERFHLRFNSKNIKLINFRCCSFWNAICWLYKKFRRIACLNLKIFDWKGWDKKNSFGILVINITMNT